MSISTYITDRGAIKINHAEKMYTIYDPKYLRDNNTQVFDLNIDFVTEYMNRYGSGEAIMSALLHVAIISHKYDMIVYLLDLGGKRTKNFVLRDLLRCASEHTKNTIDFLLQVGQNIFEDDPQYFVYDWNRVDADLRRYIIDKMDPTPDVINNIILKCIETNSVALAETIFNYELNGHQIVITDKRNLHCNLEMIQLLVKYSRIDLQEYGKVLLNYAMYKDTISPLEYLLEQGIDPNLIKPSTINDVLYDEYLNDPETWISDAFNMLFKYGYQFQESQLQKILGNSYKFIKVLQQNNVNVSEMIDRMC